MSVEDELKEAIVDAIRKKMFNAMYNGFEKLQLRTNKDTGMAAAGWVMTTGEQKTEYVPEKYPGASRRSVHGYQDDRYVSLQKEHLVQAGIIGTNLDDVNAIQITNNVPHMVYINGKWNPGFFEQCADAIRMELESEEKVELSVSATSLSED